MKADCRTVRAICEAMHAKGLRSKRGKRVGPSAMHRLLSAGYGFLPDLASYGSGPR